MPFNAIRDYLQERTARIRNEWKNFQKFNEDPSAILSRTQDADTRRHLSSFHHPAAESHKSQILQSEFDQLKTSYELSNARNQEAFELYEPLSNPKPLPDNRIPATGILPVPAYFHKGRIISANPETTRELNPDSVTDAAESYLPGDIDLGLPPHHMITTLIDNKYPQYRAYLDKYCRPAGTTDATFRDFNKAQEPSAPLDPERKKHVLTLIDHFLDITPFQPLHFVDTQYCKLPLHTGTGYHNRHSFNVKSHSKYSRPDLYAQKPTSKGYFYNATYENARTIIHHIKDSGVPFNLKFMSEDNDYTDEQIQQIIDADNDFFNSYPTLLFTRNHISDRDGTLKVRPVYAVDDIFLIIELMLTFPATVQARKPSCCIMYGLETLRGSNMLLEQISRQYRTFFTIDWSGYDQRLPRIITDVYYTDYLRSKIIISDGYAATYEYPTYPDLDEHSMYKKMDNLLHFLHLWYNNMTFVSADGYAYRRTCAGVPSGLFNTQFLDSFGNLYLLIDSMIEFGFTDEEIVQIVLLVLGDDNSAMTNWPYGRMNKFISFMETYCLERYHMVLSKTKSVITSLRNKLETLSYTCNFGKPRRPLGKLVAQLCYPEHVLSEKKLLETMSMRAIGIAYAACGQDRTFHRFCNDVYYMYLPFMKMTDEALEKARRWIPSSVIFGLDEQIQTFDLTRFPSIHEIHNLLNHYHGPLGFAPKWNYAHFINDPDYVPHHAKTMEMYEHEHSLRVRTAPNLMQ